MHKNNHKINGLRKFHKKGNAEYILENAFRIGVMTVALLAFFLLINYYINNKLETNMLQAETIANRILYSDAIMYSDENTFRVYPGIVDLKKFNDDNIKNYIQYTNERHVGIKMKILNKNPDKTKQFVAEAYVNKDNYDNLKQLLGIPGQGSATMHVRSYPITYIDIDDNYNYGQLVIEIIVPNS